MEMQPVDHVIAAVLEGDVARVAELVGADPSVRAARSMFGVSPLHAAQFTGQHDLAATLVPDAGVDLFLAADLGRLDDVERVLAERPEAAREHSAAGATALHGACYWGQLAVARRLLAAGADPSSPTRDAFLKIGPLGSAIATTPGVAQPSDDEDVVLALVRLLLEHGADVGQRRADGMTPLHSAAWRGLGRVVQELLDAGADPTVVATAGAHAGQTAADTAFGQGHLVLASRLDAGVPEVASPYG